MPKALRLSLLALAACGGFAATTQHAAAVDWNGFYAGVHGGYWQGAYTQQGDIGDETTDLPATSNYGGPILGGQLGVNATMGALVAGVEADFDWANASYAEDNNSLITDMRYGHLNWTGALTAHLGLNGGVVMPYALAGLAFANNTTTLNGDELGISDPGLSDSATHFGYTVGLGMAARLTDNISTFLEVRYADYGVAHYAKFGTDPGGAAAALSGASVRVGVNVGM